MILVLTVIVFVIILLAVIISIARKSSPKAKGEHGENVVAKILGNTIAGEQYVINDLLFKNESGKSCQIDHVFINKFGIWVIETKNYSGNIYGQLNQREWTQVLAFGHEKHKFYNPIKQNATHIYHLSKYLKVNNIFQNVVVFLSNANLSQITSDNVYTIHQLQTIKNRATHVSLSAEEMESYYNRLLMLKNSATISCDEHIKNIHTMQKQIQQGICPRCGGKLVLRNGKNEQFLGCSNYPKCRFTKGLK